MNTAWIYVSNDGQIKPKIVRASHPEMTVSRTKPGEYVVKFPVSLQAFTCVPILNQSTGAINAAVGNAAGLPANQVSVQTLTQDHQPANNYSFSLAAFSAVNEAIGFQVQGRHLYSKDGERVLLRGVNKMAAWERGDPSCAKIFPEIRKTGANVVRIFWFTDSREVLGNLPKTTVENLDLAIENCRKSNLIPLVHLWDATGDWSKLGLLVDYWTRPDVVAVIKKHQEYLLLNIANEAGDEKVTFEQFKSGYTSAITRIRNAGIRVPLIIDAADFGKEMDYFFCKKPGKLNTNARDLMDLDHRLTGGDANLVFSLHAYWDGFTPDGIPAPKYLAQKIDEIVSLNIPFVIGEFTGKSLGCTDDSPYLTVLEKCHEHEIGWMAWEWGPGNEHGDSPCAAMNMTTDGKYATIQNGWAKTVAIDHRFSIKNTAVTPRFLQGVA